MPNPTNKVFLHRSRRFTALFNAPEMRKLEYAAELMELKEERYVSISEVVRSLLQKLPKPPEGWSGSD